MTAHNGQPAWQPRDMADLLALAALRGMSFLCLRLGAADCGPAPLAYVLY